jgi:transposase
LTGSLSSPPPSPPLDPDSLPRSIPKCHQIIRDLLARTISLEARIAELELKNRRNNRALHDRRSANVATEDLSDSAKTAYEESKQELEAEKSNLSITEEETSQGGKGGGRKVPTLANRERIEEHRIEDPKMLACPCCGTKRVIIGFDVSYQLDLIKAAFETVKHVMLQYACEECKAEVVTAEGPERPIDRGYATPGLMSYVAVSKFDWHLPLYRQEKIYLSLGVPIGRASMCRWLQEGAEIAKIVVERMKELVRKCRVVQADETPLKLIKKGKGKCHKAHIWQVRGDNSKPYTIYHFTETGEGKHVADLLQGFTGIFQTDGASVFNSVIENGAVRANCVAHAYRKFEDARASDKEKADQAIVIFKSLYDIERVVKNLSDDERKDIRQRLSKPKLEKLKEWLDEQAPLVLPKSALGEAVEYCLNRWDALSLFTEHGNMLIDNNVVEAGMKPVALGRGNWLFAGSVEGGQTAALYMTLVQTCHRLGVDPFEYLKDVFTRLPSTPISEIDQFLPDRWREAHMTS